MIKKIEYLIEQCEKQGPFEEIGWKRRYCRVGRYWIAANMEVLHSPYYLLAAIEEVKQSIQFDPVNINLRLTLVQLYLDTNHFEQAEILLQSIEKDKKRLFQEAPRAGGILLYLKCLYAFYTAKSFKLKRYWKQFEEQLALTNNDPFLLVLNGRILRMIFEKRKQALDVLYQSYEKGGRYSLLYIELNSLLMADPSLLNEMNPILLKGVQWGIRYDFISKEVIEKFCFWIVQQPKENYPRSNEWERALYKWYQKTNLGSILHALCKLYIYKERTHMQAMEIYRKAWEEQVYSYQMERYYLQGAYENKIEDLPFSLIQSQLIGSQLPLELKAFLYHVVLKNLNIYGLLYAENQKSFITFAKQCLKQNKKGIYFGTLYQKLIEEELISTEDLPYLWDLLFLYNVQVCSSEIESIIIQNRDMAESQRISIKDKQGWAILSTEPSSLLCIGKKGDILPPQYNMVKIISRIPMNLLEIYVKEGYHSLPLHIALTRNSMQKEFISSKELQYIEETLSIHGLSEELQNEYKEWLALYYAKQKNYKKAKEYYDQLPLESLQLETLQEGIRTMIYTKEFEEAFLWLSKIGISWLERKEILTIVEKSVQAKINSPYKVYLQKYLLTQGMTEGDWVDDLQQSVVGAIEEILQLKSQLDTYGILTEPLAWRILQQSVLTRQWNEDIERIFIQTYQKNQKSRKFEDLISFCIYLILHQQQMLQNATIEILESLFLQDKAQLLLGYALLAAYGYQLIETSKSHEVIDYMIPVLIQNQLHFPWLHNIKDKTQYISYIEKNVSFLCTASSKDRLWFYYKNQEEDKYHSLPMIYIGMGLYTVSLPVFYQEEIEYYLQNQHGTIIEQDIYHRMEFVLTKEEDSYDLINNGLLYYSLFQFNEVEDSIEEGILFYQPKNQGILL